MNKLHTMRYFMRETNNNNFCKNLKLKKKQK